VNSSLIPGYDDTKVEGKLAVARKPPWNIVRMPQQSLLYTSSSPKSR